MGNDYTKGYLVNTLTDFDQTFFDKWSDTLTVYPSDARGREKVVSARMVGPDEEFQEAEYPIWSITPLEFVFDRRRYSDEKRRDSAVSVSGVSSMKIYNPDQPYLITYIVVGSTQDMRILRAMQEFVAVTFPEHAYISVGGVNHYVETRSFVSHIDVAEREYILRVTFDVWATLEVPDYVDYKTVFNDIVIGYTTKQGRYERGSSSEEIQTIEG